MKIILINNLYPPYSVGGAEKVVEEQAKKLLAEGKEVVIITARPWQGFKAIKPSAGKDGEVIIYRLWQPNIFWYKDLSKHKLLWKLIWHFFDVFNPLASHWVREILEKEKPDEVWTDNLMGLSYKVYPVKYCLGQFNRVNKVIKFIKSNVKWTHYLHDVQLVEPSGVLPWNHEKDKFYQKIYSWIMKKRLGTPDVVVALSNFIGDFYWSRGFFSGAKWDVDKISNFQFSPATAGSRLRSGTISPANGIPSSQRDKQIPNSNVKFLFVGSLVKHKGIEVLMQAWEQVNSDPPVGGEESLSQASLHLVGDGILRMQVEECAKNFSNVNVYGRLEKEELEKVYENCDILIFPSLCLENRPTVILEALQHGLLIIAADTGGVRELVKVNENAWLFTPGNVEELVKRMKRFV